MAGQPDRSRCRPDYPLSRVRRAATDPQWYRNLVAKPAVQVEIGTPAGTESCDAAALVTTGTEYDELWARIVAAYPFFTDHQANVDRRIPVVALERA